MFDFANFLFLIYSAIHSPYALCNLTKTEQKREIRPAFVNYGGYYQDSQHGEKRTYNSLAIHVSRSLSQSVFDHHRLFFSK